MLKRYKYIKDDQLNCRRLKFKTADQHVHPFYKCFYNTSTYEADMFRHTMVTT
jgi:hypothetical protein